MSEEEKARIAAGNESGIGPIQLDDYPEQLREDKITITIPNRDGKKVTKVISVNVSNNELNKK
ncbi:hypothetical protein KHA96_01800 [Bacillus sp. FJAT-49711]|uniref:hypothetical protein n=1 Tax=Bacillus sp. FJAT-49711 TaxID=2833585 RepID=UPI001BC9E468|nr:hypothetical protein [Bacillus sp. FJAT-49711]MBS4217043.1 hypothetical protein [Bacillus sp. FJAT-49711]